MNEWKDFFIVTAGAAATLTGLIFVGVSISLAKILSVATLPGRAFISLLLLLTILVLSILFMVPALSLFALGVINLVIGVIVWVITLVIDIRILRNKRNQYKKLYLFNMLLNQLSVLPYIIAGVFICSNGISGLIWIAPAMVFSFIKAVLDAWFCWLRLTVESQSDY